MKSVSTLYNPPQMSLEDSPISRRTDCRKDSVMSNCDEISSSRESLESNYRQAHDGSGRVERNLTRTVRQWSRSAFIAELTAEPTPKGQGSLPTPALTEVPDVFDGDDPESDSGHYSDTQQAPEAMQLCTLGTTKVDPFCPNTSHRTPRQMDALLSHCRLWPCCPSPHAAQCSQQSFRLTAQDTNAVPPFTMFAAALIQAQSSTP